MDKSINKELKNIKKNLSKKSKDFSQTLKFEQNIYLSNLYGEFDKNIKILEKEIGVTIHPRGNLICLNGDLDAVNKAKFVIEKLYESAKKNNIIDYGEIKGILNMTKNIATQKDENKESEDGNILIKAGRKLLKPRSLKQTEYFKMVSSKEMVFCCGPAGTGKTYLAVAFAVSMLKAGQIEKIVLSRPAVEAGERLGFLQGDLKDKVYPFLRPIYDALNDMLPIGEVIKKIDNGSIEIAPLAFMRGRTLTNAFVIIDEAQNTTPVQMKMVLTRLGEDSRMIITGDLSQIDLPSGQLSGLSDAVNRLEMVKGIGIIRLSGEDIVRHSVVARILKAYETRQN